MALSKPFNTKFGVTANYHKLLKAEVDAVRNQVELVVAIYADETAKNSGANPMWTEYVRIPFENLSFDPREVFYPLLKEYSNSYLVNSADLIDPGKTPHPPVFSIVEPQTAANPPVLPPMQ